MKVDTFFVSSLFLKGGERGAAAERERRRRRRKSSVRWTASTRRLFVFVTQSYRY
jgi:hypothetical protein